MNALDSLYQWVLLLLGNAIWQVALLGGVAFVVLRFGRVRSPQWRYGICMGALAAIIACPIVTALALHTGLGLYQFELQLAKTPVAAPNPAPLPPAEPITSPASQPSNPIPDWTPIDAPSAGTTQLAIAQTPPVPAKADGRLPPAAVAGSRIPSERATAAEAAPRVPAPFRWLALVYLWGLAAMLMWLGVGQMRLLRLRSEGEPVPGDMSAMLERLSQLTGVRRRVQVCLSDRIATPVLIGLVRPTILIPTAMARISPLDAEAILLHELAHISRRDQWVNLLQRLAKSALFFHPVIWLLGREIRVQREHCCDAWVVGRTGREMDYARCLTDLARRLFCARQAIPGVAMAERRHELPRRIAAVLDGSARAAHALPRGAVSLILAAALTTATLIGGCGLTSRAQGQTLAEIEAAGKITNTLSGTGTVTPMNINRTGSMRGMPNVPATPVFPNRAGPGGVVSPFNKTALATAAAPPSSLPTDRILVLTGERVKCRVTGAILEDIHYEYRPASEKSEYYDDGTHGDLVAGDNIWTNFSERQDVLSPSGNLIKDRYLNMLRIVERTNPIDFFGTTIASEDPLSRMPKTMDEERDRDEKFIREWHRRYLADYRLDSEDPTSDFYPLFVPRPPRPPDVPTPPQGEFSPSAYVLDAFIQQTVQGATVPLIEAESPREEPAARRGSASQRRPAGRPEGAVLAR